MTPREARAFGARHHTGLSVIGLSLALALLPLVVTNPWKLGILNIVALHLIVVLGLNLFVGYAGQISLGHAAFFGLGAYGAGILATRYAVPAWAGIPAAAGGVGAVALLIGIPTLKLSGHYLAMATLGFNVVVHNGFVQWDAVTGGPSGLTGIPPLGALGRELQGEVAHFYLLWTAAMLALTLCLNLVRSGIGRGLAALAEDEVAAAAVGVDVRRGKLAVFVVSAILAAIAGGLFAHYLGTLTPDTFGIFASIDFVIMVVIGGVGSLWGSLAGAGLVTVLPHLLGPLEEYKDILYGLVVVGTLLVLPRGPLVGAAEALVRLRRPRARKGEAPA